MDLEEQKFGHNPHVTVWFEHRQRSELLLKIAT